MAADRRLDRGGRSIARDHPGQRPRTRERRRHRRVRPQALRRRPRRRVGSSTSHLAPVRHGAQRPLACGQDRAEWPGRLYVALFRRGSTSAPISKTPSARRPACHAFLGRRGLESLRRRARRPKAESLERVFEREPGLVRARRRPSACRSNSSCRAAHRQHAHHRCARREGGAGIGARRRCDRRAAGGRGASNRPPPPMFAPITLRGVTFPNRVAVSPMCTYSAKDGSRPTGISSISAAVPSAAPGSSSPR